MLRDTVFSSYYKHKTIDYDALYRSCNEFTQKDIVVTATAGSMSVKVNIKVSDQPDIDGYLAVARNTASSLSGYTYMRDFVG